LFWVWTWIFVAAFCRIVAGIGGLLPLFCQNKGVVTGVLPNLGDCGRDIAEKGVFLPIDIWMARFRR
jgi:hypothetical protein